ncbi:MAG: ribose 5-phosphate isomerase B [Bacilli bacterium]
MKIGITNDHRGLVLKQTLTNYLENKGYNIIDYGTDSDDSVDYPDYAFKLGKSLQTKDIDLGIAICGTGIGMDIALNKVKGIRCAKASNEEEAILARSHNDANALALSAKISSDIAKDIVDKFINTNFSNDKRHIERIQKIKEYEND